MKQITFSIIKPDAVKRNLVGEIIRIFEENKLFIVAMKMVLLQQSKAEGFYKEHKGKSFFDDLIKMITDSPCVLLVLEGENAVEKTRQLIGSTDPSKADEGTIRHKFALSLQKNSVHASDSLDSSIREIGYFFDDAEVHRRLS